MIQTTEASSAAPELGTNQPQLVYIIITPPMGKSFPFVFLGYIFILKIINKLGLAQFMQGLAKPSLPSQPAKLGFLGQARLVYITN